MKDLTKVHIYANLEVKINTYYNGGMCDIQALKPINHDIKTLTVHEDDLTPTNIKL